MKFVFVFLDASYVWENKNKHIPWRNKPTCSPVVGVSGTRCCGPTCRSWNAVLTSWQLYACTSTTCTANNSCTVKIQKHRQEFTRENTPRNIAASHTRCPRGWTVWLEPGCSVCDSVRYGWSRSTMRRRWLLNIWQNVWFSHHWLEWVWATHCRRELWFSCWTQCRVMWTAASLSRAPHFAVVDCLHACFHSPAHTPLPLCLLQMSVTPPTSLWGQAESVIDRQAEGQALVNKKDKKRMDGRTGRESSTGKSTQNFHCLRCL